MIAIKNIYYMLAYAFQTLHDQGYKSIDTQKFETAGELCAAILERGIIVLLKQGLGRDYISETETISAIKGKIDVSASLKRQSLIKHQLVCTYDEFSVNSYMNQILKSTVLLLLKFDISKERKKSLRKLMIYFSEVEEIDLYTVNWNLHYDRNNQTYQLLISLCYLIFKGLLHTNATGSKKLLDFFDEQRMSNLYEKFILAYYRKHFPKLKAEASQIPWKLDDDNKYMLPIMQSDITLSTDNCILIIDAKYYGKNTQENRGSNSIISGNLYQIFTYVKNKALMLCNKDKKIAGMLLYAKTDHIIQPNITYRMSGNEISAKTLDLNCDFEDIKENLNQIIYDFFD